MSRIAAFVLLISTAGLASVFSSGCGNLTGAADAAGQGGDAAARPVQGTGIAVIDIDEVARRLGSDLQIVNEVKQRESRLSKDLEALQVSYTRQLEDRKRELNYKPTDEQNRELAKLDADLGTKLQQARLDAQRELARHQGALITRLRERVRPVAREVARRHGMNMIVVKNLDVLFDFDTSLDITNEVAEKLLAQQGPASTGSDAGPGQQDLGQQDLGNQNLGQRDFSPEPGRPSSADYAPQGRAASSNSPRPFPQTADQPPREMSQRR